ncbi:MAG: carbohydrate kinase [Bacilli bacterium]|nr:carbohydrate kinase [Bacilli bacterium]
MLISIGEILVDIFKDGNSKTTLPGGAPFNVACNALLYTKEVGFIGTIGNDEDGRLLKATAESKPFKLLFLKELSDRYTSKAIVSLDNGERSFKFDRSFGADYIFDINSINFKDIKDNDIIHIGSLMLSEKEGREFFFELVKRIKKETNAKISFDINYRDDIFNSEAEAKEIFIKALKEADILKFSIEEVELLTKEKDLVKGLKTLLNENQIAVITLGSKGSIYYHKSHIVEVPTYKVKPVDTTGAGDAFYSYFLASLVNHPEFINCDKEIIHYLTRANVVGGLATLKKGAINVAPCEEEIDQFLASIK